jgi:hypothetical protein
MKITPFNLKDLGAFIPNEYSDPDEIFPLFLDARYTVQTLWGEDGLVQAIICFHNYWGSCWSCFVLIARDFRLFNAYLMRNLIDRYMAEHGAVRLQTESRADDTLRAWHRFLGFKHEGVKKKMMFNQDYDCWAIVREEA